MRQLGEGVRTRTRVWFGLVGVVALLVVAIPAAIPSAAAVGEEFLVINEKYPNTVPHSYCSSRCSRA